ncbi:putative transporter [Oscillibacter valericigenes Sjm18-20]|nr:putative transporter [Oscillibacter valericigenes Sjm18-20]
MKKKALSLILATLMVISLAACGSASSNSSSSPSSSSASAASSGDGSTPEYTWTAANVLAEDSVYGVALHKFADLIHEKSNGSITVDVYDAGTLGTEKECMEGLQMGTVDFEVASTATCSNFTASQTIYDLPYLFQNSAQAREVLQGDTCQGILGELSDVSIKGITYFENGIYAIISKSPIQSLSDMSGKKIRAIESNLQTDTYAALGATGVAIAWGDCYTALQTGVCDGISSTTIPNMYSAKFYEVGKYITRTNHGYSPCLFAMSQTLWDSLDADTQNLIVECANEARDYQYDYIDDMLVSLQTEMEAAGVTFYNIDTTEWADACAPIYDKYVGAGANQIDPNLVAQIQSEAAQIS